LGSAVVTGIANVTPTGVSATGSIGTVIIAIGSNVVLTGVSATGSAGNPLVWGDVDTSQTPGWQLVVGF